MKKNAASTNNTKSSNKPTFYIHSPWFEGTAEKELTKRGWQRVGQNTKQCVDNKRLSGFTDIPLCCDHQKNKNDTCVRRDFLPVDYFQMDGKDRRSSTRSQKSNGSKIRNRFQEKSINNLIDKGKLHRVLEKTKGGRKYLLAQLSFNHKNALTTIKQLPVKYVILKPTASYGGKGVLITEKTDIGNIKAHLKKYRKYKNWVVQEYLHNPMLFKGHKFHLRMYVMLFKQPNGKSYAFLYPEGWIYTAPKKYPTTVQKAIDTMHDSEIHITNISAGGKGYPFPSVFNKSRAKYLFAQMADLVWHSTKSSLKRLRCYELKNQACFDVLGIDLMVTKNGHIKLLEYNTGVGFNLTGYKNKSYERCWRAELMAAVYRATLDKIIKPSGGKHERSRKKCPEIDFIKLTPQTMKKFKKTIDEFEW